jgi:hypothetical protein
MGIGSYTLPQRSMEVALEKMLKIWAKFFETPCATHVTTRLANQDLVNSLSLAKNKKGRIHEKVFIVIA